MAALRTRWSEKAAEKAGRSAGGAIAPRAEAAGRERPLAVVHAAPVPLLAVRSLAEDIARRIRDGIAHGRFAAGQRLIETDLATLFDIGRSTVREALMRLAAEGVIVNEPHRGAVVRRLTRDDVVELYRVREALEGLVARQAAEAVGGSGVADPELRAMLKRAASLGGPRETSAFLPYNKAFHGALVTLAANALLDRLLDQANAPVFQLQFRTLLTPQSIAISNEEHARIADAVLAGRGKRAEEAMRTHIRHSARLTLSLPKETFGA